MTDHWLAAFGQWQDRWEWMCGCGVDGWAGLKEQAGKDFRVHRQLASKAVA